MFSCPRRLNERINMRGGDGKDNFPQAVPVAVQEIEWDETLNKAEGRKRRAEMA